MPATAATVAAAPVPDTVPTTTAAPSTTAPPSTTTLPTPPPAPDTGDVAGFEIITARLDGQPLILALADTPDLQRRGLMEVRSMGDLDGMVFVWEDPRPVSFWMKGTLIPLDIGFFDPEGVLFQVLSMTPCAADPCPTYPSEAPTRYALEARPGFFDDLSWECAEGGLVSPNPDPGRDPGTIPSLSCSSEKSLSLGETVASP